MTEPVPAGPLVLTERSWEDLLDFLDPSRPGKHGAGRDAEAETRYLQIVRKLVCFFAGRGCRDAEDLAVECVLRVAGKCAALDASARQDRLGYFYGVARNVLHEWWRRELRDSKTRESLRTELAGTGWGGGPSWSRKEAVHGCLDRCMAELSHRSRRLVLEYYAEAGAAKIEAHQKLAAALGKSLNALRIEVHRIRAVLRQCVVGCVQPGAGAAGRPTVSRG
jgi:DNA-directed RNA polymerase specialized sigma24 family protein